MKQAPTEPVYNGQEGREASDSCKYPGLSVLEALSCMVLLAGGYWGSSSNCGSRCRIANNSLSDASVLSGARGRSLPKGSFHLGGEKVSISTPLIRSGRGVNLRLQNRQIFGIGAV